MVIFAIVTALIWGLGEMFYKKGSHAKEKYSHLKIAIFVGIAMGIHACIILLTEDINFDPYNLIIYAPISFCYILSMVCSYFGVKFIAESISDPIENSSCALVPLLCVVISHEELDPWVIVGIVVIFIGIIGVGFLENRGETDIKKKLGKRLAVFAFAMPFCYAIFDAVGTFLDDRILTFDTTTLVNVTEETIENVGNTCYELTFLFVAIAFLIFIAFKKVRLFSIGDAALADGTLVMETPVQGSISQSAEPNDKIVIEDTDVVNKNEVQQSDLTISSDKQLGIFYKIKVKIIQITNKVLVQKDKILAALCETAGQFTYVFALSGDGAIAAPIIGGGCVVVSLLLSRIFLKEKLTRLQYVFVGLILVGIIIISIIEG